MWNKLRQWWEYRQYIRATKRIMRYLIMSSFGQDEALFAWYLAGFETVIHVSNKVFVDRCMPR